MFLSTPEDCLVTFILFFIQLFPVIESTLFVKHFNFLLQAEGIYENPLDILQDMKFDIKVEDNEAADKVCSNVMKYLRYRPQAQ